MKTAEEWMRLCPEEIQDIMNQVVGKEVFTKLPSLSWIKQIQTDALRESIRIADTFALNHKLSAPEVIVAIQIRDAIERLVKEIEK